MAGTTEANAADLLPAKRPIVLFDGVCNLCNGVVQFVLPRDSAGRFRFAPLQSEPGQTLLAHFGMATEEFDTFVLVDGEDVYTRSDAALRLLGGLDFPWSLLGAFHWIPRPLRDAVYDAVARVRYDVFGRKDRCVRPSREESDVFLDRADVIPGEDRTDD